MTAHLSAPLRAVIAKQGASSVDPNTLISAEAQSAIHTKFAQFGPQGEALYHQFIFAVRDGLAITMQPLFHLALGFMLCAFVFSLFLKEVPLRKHQLTPAAVPADQEADVVGAPEPVGLRAPSSESA
jgi:hypothetical protein